MEQTELLLNTRRVELERYLNDIIKNRNLCNDPALWIFLEAEDFVGTIKEFKLDQDTPQVADLKRKHSGDAPPDSDPVI